MGVIQGMAKDDSIDCPGCRKLINGAPYFHVGAPIEVVRGQLCTRQPPGEQIPAMALLHNLGTQDLIFIVPIGLSVESLEPAIEALQQEFQGQPLGPVTMIKALRSLRESATHACRLGAIVRDFRGNWHVAGKL
jgi:hypothetical protein